MVVAIVRWETVGDFLHDQIVQIEGRTGMAPYILRRVT